MPDPRPPDTRTFARYVVIALAIGATAALFWVLSHVFLLAFAGVVLATALRALSAPLTRYTGLSERWSVLVVVLCVVAMIASIVWLFGSQVAGQLTELAQRVPQAAEKLRNWTRALPMGQLLSDSLMSMGEGGGSALQRLTRVASGTLGLIANTLLIFFLALYFAFEPRGYVEGVLRLVPLSARDNARRAMHKSASALRKWLLGQGISMLGVGVATGIGLSIVGVPLALALGLVAGIAEFVPIIGPIVAAIPGVLIGFSVSPETAMWAVLVYVIVQQLEGNLIMPLAQRWAVALPPAVGLLSVVAFGLLFGVLGVLFATPLCVVCMVLVRELYVKDVLESPAGKLAAREATQEKRATAEAVDERN